ncbi:hypothetical protein BH23GEM6_BH23GEM6_08900 [soil metagenome]
MLGHAWYTPGLEWVGLATVPPSGGPVRNQRFAGIFGRQYSGAVIAARCGAEFREPLYAAVQGGR